jgi:hypothetical protein
MCALKFLIDALLCRLHGEKSSGHGAGEAISSYNSYSRLVSNALGCHSHSHITVLWCNFARRLYLTQLIINLSWQVCATWILKMHS